MAIVRGERRRLRSVPPTLGLLALFGVSSAGIGLGAPPAAAQSGPSPDATATVTTLNRALRATLAGTARVSITLAGSAVGAAGASRVRATGAFDFTSARGAVVLAPGAGIREPIVFTPAAVFIKPPGGSASVLPKGKPWMIANFSTPEALATNFPQFVLQIESIDPAFTLSELAWGIVSATDQGPARAGGQPARRYGVTIDLRRALAAADGPAKAPFSFAFQSELDNLPAGSSSSGTITASVWLSPSGRVSQVSLSPPGAGVGTTTLATSNFGTAVTTSPPPSSQTVDVAELTPSGERENNHGGDSDGG